MLKTGELSVATPADWVPGPSQGSWTYEDYAALPEDGRRYEIVNGVLVMAPAPTPEHQSTIARLTYYLLFHVEFAGLGRFLPAPVDVELAPDNTFQPDAVVILNAHLDRVGEKKIMGAPALAVEVASIGTAVTDLLVTY